MAALSLLARLRRYLGNRRAAPRLTAQVEARLLLTGEGEAGPSLEGRTVDLSESGLGLLVTAALEGHADVISHGVSTLRVTLALPTGRVEMKAITARYVHVKHLGEADVYFIGARIAEVDEIDRSRYQGYLLMLQD